MYLITNKKRNFINAIKLKKLLRYITSHIYNNMVSTRSMNTRSTRNGTYITASPVSAVKAQRNTVFKASKNVMPLRKTIPNPINTRLRRSPRIKAQLRRCPRIKTQLRRSPRLNPPAKNTFNFDIYSRKQYNGWIHSDWKLLIDDHDADYYWGDSDDE